VRLPDPPLLLITDRHQARQPLPEVVAEALATGCRWVSLREKDLPRAEQVRLVGQLLPLARRWGARLSIHGDAAAASATGADGVHLPAGGDPKAAREQLGDTALVGLSIHTVIEARALDATTLDYAIAGPMFATSSKPGYGPTLGCSGLAAIVRASSVPVIAVGGITAENMAAVRSAGAAGVAVMGGIMRAADPGEQARRLLEALARYP
jgi:thiamine-phosphate pyrophosphorylase